jgi:hypothetical protein
VTNTFIRKVSVERMVLGVVNAITPGSRQLAGLSAAAIEAWRRGADVPAAEETSRRLLRIAALCQLLSDRSHESFHSLDPALMEKIDGELADLKLLIDNAKQARKVRAT